MKAMKARKMLDKTHAMKCPFCGNHALDMKPEKTVCSECSTKFEIEDRSECIFVDVNNPKLPINGTVCNVCGLVQVEASETCMNCGEKLYIPHGNENFIICCAGEQQGIIKEKAYLQKLNTVI